MKNPIESVTLENSMEVGGFAAGMAGMKKMVDGYGTLTAANSTTSPTEKGQFFAETHENHLKGVSFLTLSAFITGLASGDWTYLIMQPPFVLTSIKKYYESHPEDLAELNPQFQKFVNFLIKNWNLESTIGTNGLLVAFAIGISNADLINVIQVLGAATISTALETIGKFKDELGIVKSQSFMLAGRVAMLVSSGVKVATNPTGASASWLALMSWAAYKNSQDLTNSYKASKERNPQLKVRDVINSLGKNIKNRSMEK